VLLLRGLPLDRLRVLGDETVVLAPCLGAERRSAPCGKEIAHLTYHRLTVVDDAKTWRNGEIWMAIRVP
jgi:hypothetical protein